MCRSKKILVAPLNWGLGHATRCIPIIGALLENGHVPYIASDGAALSLLRQEFPHLKSFELPSYEIQYAEKGKHFKLKMIWDAPKVIKAITQEKKQLKKMIRELALDGVISDNRLGIYSKKVPCIFLTHQLNVLSGNTTWFSSKIHQKIIKKYHACWVPDVEGKPNLTGKLGHVKKSKLQLTYLGPLSRFQKKKSSITYDLMVLLSGPEPQRTLLELKLLNDLQAFCGKVLFVKGKIENENIQRSIITDNGEITIYNFMKSKELGEAINSSKLILCRSGYTTVMDLAKLEKKAFFIPTPGQYEQEYLAKRLKKQGLAPFKTQEEFKLQHLEEVSQYRGLKAFNQTIDYGALFEAFSNVKENSEPMSSSLST